MPVLEACDLEDGREALFQSVDRAGERLTARALTRRVVLAMIKRRSATAGLPPSTCCHTFRATGLMIPGPASLAPTGDRFPSERVIGFDRNG